MEQKNIGWIGLGKMGEPMAMQLIKAGLKVTVFNRSKEKEAALKSAGAFPANSPADVAKVSDLVFVMVSDDQAINDIFTAENGLLDNDLTGKVIINMSTVSSGISKKMSGEITRKGGFYLDAPVSGSVGQAENGQLVIMAGGDEAIFEKVKPLFEHLGKMALRVGEVGAGNSAKLVINTLLAIHAQALAEAVNFAGQSGIEPDDLLSLLNSSALGNIFIKFKGQAILDNNFDAVFALKHIAKDLRLAKNEGLDAPLGNVAYETFQAAEPTYGELDIIGIKKQLE